MRRIAKRGGRAADAKPDEQVKLPQCPAERGERQTAGEEQEAADIEPQRPEAVEAVTGERRAKAGNQHLHRIDRRHGSTVGLEIRSEERRVGKAGCSTGKSRWSP